MLEATGPESAVASGIATSHTTIRVAAAWKTAPTAESSSRELRNRIRSRIAEPR